MQTILSTSPARPAKEKSFWRALLLSIVVAGLNFGLWTYLNKPAQPQAWTGKIGGFAYAPYQRHQSPLNLSYPSVDEIDRDLKQLSQYTDHIRTYAALENPAIPELARKYGLKVLAGAYLDNRDAAQRRRTRTR